jgi:hypothetical protein
MTAPADMHRRIPGSFGTDACTSERENSERGFGLAASS